MNRINITDPRLARSKAVALRKSLDWIGTATTLTRSQATVAAVYGHPDWASLLRRNEGLMDLTLVDDGAVQDLIASRHQVDPAKARFVAKVVRFADVRHASFEPQELVTDEMFALGSRSFVAILGDDSMTLSLRSVDDREWGLSRSMSSEAFRSMWNGLTSSRPFRIVTPEGTNGFVYETEMMCVSSKAEMRIHGRLKRTSSLDAQGEVAEYCIDGVSAIPVWQPKIRQPVMISLATARTKVAMLRRVLKWVDQDMYADRVEKTVAWVYGYHTWQTLERIAPETLEHEDLSGLDEEILDEVVTHFLRLVGGAGKSVLALTRFDDPRHEHTSALGMAVDEFAVSGLKEIVLPVGRAGGRAYLMFRSTFGNGGLISHSHPLSAMDVAAVLFGLGVPYDQKPWQTGFDLRDGQHTLEDGRRLNYSWTKVEDGFELSIRVVPADDVLGWPVDYMTERLRGLRA
jgi:hypothetical protein